MIIVAPLVIALAVSLILTPLVRAAMVRAGVLDHPVARSSHHEPKATCGGFAIFISFWVTTLILQWPPDPVTVGTLVGSLLLLVICFVDDLRGLDPLIRLPAQIGIAGVTYWWGVRVVGFANPLSFVIGPQYVFLGHWSMPVTILWIVFIINAVNWLDGIDGLAAGVSGIAGLALAGVAAVGGMASIAIPAAALAGSAFGFLRLNFNPAKVFMGDVGAMFLGYILACLAIMGAVKGPTALVLVVPVLVLGLPIYDSAATIINRLMAGQPIYQADRKHLHHRLMDQGLSVRETVLLMYGITGLLCVIALGVWVR